MRGLRRAFYGVRALDGVDLSVARGTITGLIGPNGAGKTTLFNCVSGLIPPDAGRVVFDGHDVTGWPPHRVTRRGLLRTFQVARGFPRLSVLENLLLYGAAQPGETLWRALLGSRSARARERALVRRAWDVAARLDLATLLNAPASALSGGQKKLLELGRSLMGEPRLILLDEIGAGINRTLLGKVAEKIKRLNEERGLTFCLIEHDLDYVSRLCGDVIVMAQGAVLTRGTIEEVRHDERVIEAYFGGGKYEVGT